jgi:type IV pilus assembly protein PilA
MASRSSGFDPSMTLMAAAIALPNLVRARIAANESSAIASIRTVNVAQVTYSSTYPDRGYAQDLSRLGPDPSPAGKASFEHANLIDATLLNSTCTAGAGCEKNGFRFSVTAACKTKHCGEYVVTAAPVSSGTGTKNFCSTSDAVVRSKAGDPISSPITAAECRTWPPISMSGSRIH